MFDPSGRFLRVFGSQGTSDGKFSYPWGVTTDALGFIYVCDKVIDNSAIKILFAPEVDAFYNSNRRTIEYRCSSLTVPLLGNSVPWAIGPVSWNIRTTLPLAVQIASLCESIVAFLND